MNVWEEGRRIRVGVRFLGGGITCIMVFVRVVGMVVFGYYSGYLRKKR